MQRCRAAHGVALIRRLSKDLEGALEDVTVRDTSTRAI
jgi:hypothetical protein